MSRYNVECEWDGYNWVGTVEGVPGAVTQAKRLELIPGRITEVLKLMTGKRVNADDIELRFHPGGEAEADAETVRALRADVERIQSDLATRQVRLIRTLRKQGFTVRDIGTIVGLSHQRVQQLLASSARAKSPRARSRATTARGTR